MTDSNADDVRRIGRDPDAFEAFYRQHLEAVQRFVARRVADPHLAADLTADVFLAAIDGAGKYRPERGSPGGWLMGVARHVVAAEFRRQGRQRDLVRRISGRRLLDADSLNRIEERLDAERETRRLYAALAELPERDRALVELVALDGLAVAEAGAVLGVKPGTARVRLHRSRRLVQSHLQLPGAGGLQRQSRRCRGRGRGGVSRLGDGGPRAPYGGRLRHRLRRDVDDEAVHRRRGTHPADAARVADQRPDLPPSSRCAGRQAGHHDPPPADAHRRSGRHPRRRRRAGIARRTGRRGPRLGPAHRAGRRVPLLERRLQPAGRDHPAGVRPGVRGVPRRAPLRARVDDPHRLRASGLGSLTACGRVRRRRRRSGATHRSSLGERRALLDAEAASQLVEPRVREEPGGDTWYAYGWVAQDVDGLDVLWHNGGNGWAYGELWRIPERDAMVFWVTNQARGSSWDFEELGPELSQGVIERLRRGA